MPYAAHLSTASAFDAAHAARMLVKLGAMQFDASAQNYHPIRAQVRHHFEEISSFTACGQITAFRASPQVSTSRCHFTIMPLLR